MRDRFSLRSRRFLAEALGLSSMLWLATAIGVIVGGATLPDDTEIHFTFLLLVLITETLLIKIWLMWRRTTRLTRLGTALICFNVTFLTAYYVGLVLMLWPEFRVTHRWLVVWGPRLLILAGCIWVVIEMAISRDPQRIIGTSDRY